MTTFGKVASTIGLFIICGLFNDLGANLIKDNHDLVGIAIIGTAMIVQFLYFGKIWELE